MGVRRQQRTRVRHRGVEPQRIERVAEVVVRVDVAAGLCPGVAVQQVADTVHEATDEGAVDQPVCRFAVAQEERQEPREVRGGPVAGDVRLREADVAAGECRADDVPVVQLEVGGMRVAPGAETRALAVGKAHVGAAVLKVLEQAQREPAMRRKARSVDAAGVGKDEFVHRFYRVTGWAGGAGFERKGTRRMKSFSACQ